MMTDGDEAGNMSSSTTKIATDHRYLPDHLHPVLVRGFGALASLSSRGLLRETILGLASFKPFLLGPIAIPRCDPRMSLRPTLEFHARLPELL